SQLFFPIAVFWCFLHYWEKRGFKWLLAAGFLFAVGAGFRPSDGAFFAPAFLYGLAKGKRTHIVPTFAAVSLLCLIWLIPQQVALSKQTMPVERNLGSHLDSMAEGVLVVGFSPYALSNAIRLIIPLVLALFPILGMIFHNRKQVFLWIWI